MDASQESPDRQNPFQVYSHRLQQLGRERAHAQERERLLGYAKLALAAVTVIAAFWLLRHPALVELLLVPMALFVFLSVLHEKRIQSIRRSTRSIEFYERGIARLENRWAGKGETGDRFLDPQHPYARDLDLFGQASLFELLSAARTRAGEETLAAWLLAAAPLDEIAARQEAIRDLSNRVAFRENLFLLGETVRTGVHPDALAVWGESGPVFAARATRIATSLLAVIWIASLVCWGVWDFGWFAAVMTLVNLGWSRQVSARLDKAAGGAEHATQDLELLSGVLALIEQEHFASPKLAKLQAALKSSGIAPSVAIRRLARIVEYLDQRHNMFFRPLDRIVFWSAQLVFAAEDWQQKFGSQIRGWLSAVGEMEALTSLSAYAYEHPDDVFPELVAPTTAHNSLFEAEGLAHPLLPSMTSVRNNVKLGDGLHLVILSGPNMAGKSTFIRSIGLNAVLAQCGAPVRATRLRLSPLNVAASICILDSLSGGISRFYAEIQRVKRIADLTSGATPVLFLLDELLSGTNSHDRLAGTEFIVRTFVARYAIGIVSTHDLALTRIPDAMGARAANYHFEDCLENSHLVFDYKLKPGIVQTSNALELMRSIGLDIETPRPL
jgi:hypothetical protein